MNFVFISPLYDINPCITPGIMTNLGRSELKFTQGRGKIMEENGVRKIRPIHPGRKNIL